MANTFSISIKGYREAAALFGARGQKALDSSARSAVTFTAKDYTKDKFKRIATDIDRPAPFTRNRRVYSWDGAAKSGPIVGRAYVNTRQSEYLQLVETGGERRASPGGGRPMNPQKNVADRYGGLFGRKGLQKKFLKSGPGRTSGTAPSGIGANGRPSFRTGAKRYFVATLNIPGSGPTRGLFERTKLSKAKTKRNKKVNLFGENSANVRLSTIRKANRKVPGFYSGSGKYRNPGWKTRLLVRFEDRAEYKPQLGFVEDGMKYGRAHLAPTFDRLFRERLARLA